MFSVPFAGPDRRVERRCPAAGVPPSLGRMSTLLSESPPQAATAEETRNDRGGWIVGVLLFSSLCIVVGLIWDISWHMTIGRDTLWSAPHVLEQVGAALAGLSCGYVALRTTFAGTPEQRAATVRFWGFRAPLGAWIAIWGAFAMIFSVPFDNWWHNAYGLDVEILSPPHVVLMSGALAIQIAAIIVSVGFQNRAPDGRRYAVACVIGAGALVAMVALGISEFTIQPNTWHTGLTWMIAGLVFPYLLCGISRAGRLRWPGTWAALAYMAIFLVTQWILVQFPATPRLTPIVRPLTQMAAYGFPMLLVVPASAFDLLIRKWDDIGDWKLAGVLGSAFVILIVAVHWPFATFLLESPLAQNDFFLARHWPYFATPGEWERTFFDPQPLLNVRLLFAMLLATVSARAGLAWGAWLRRVRR